MNWTHFLPWLAAAYSLYYLTMILWDNAKKHPQLAAAPELTFSEQHQPQDVALHAQTPGTPEMIASGGVPLKEVFTLARKEAIVYLKEVSFN